MNNSVLNYNEYLIQLFRKMLIFLYIISVFSFSLYVSSWSMEGDQVHYSKAYDSVDGLRFSDAIVEYRQIIYSYEPIHFIVIWLASNTGISKTIFMSFMNTLLVYLAYLVLKKLNFNFLYIMLILIPNYYFYVMFFTLEKLKVAFIFLLIFLLFRNSIKNKFLIFFLPIFSHFQMLLVMFTGYFSKKIRVKNKVKLKHRDLLKLILIIFVIFFVIYILKKLFFSFLVSKLLFYYRFSRNQGISSLKILILISIITFFSTSQRTSVVIYYCFFAIYIIILGSDRLNMFVYFGYLFYINPKKQISKVSIVITSTYLFLKSIEYFSSLYNYAF